MKKTIEQLQPIELHRLGGQGNKINRVALNEVDSYIQTRVGLSFWDLCAPECLVRAMGGLCTDFNQLRFVYDMSKNHNSADLRPFIVANRPGIHALIINRLQ